MAASRNILFIGTVFPEPVSSAAGLRTEALLEDFRSRGDRILFASPSDRNSFSDDLRARGIETVQIGPNDPAFDALLREFKPEIVVFDRFILEEQFGWRVAEFAPQAIRVLDTIDLHFLRRERGERLRKLLAGSGGREGASVSDADLHALTHDLRGIETEDSLREAAAIHRSDLNLMISAFESDLLQQRFAVPPATLLTLGFSYSDPEVALWPADAERRNFVSIGNFRHLPNRDAAFWMARELWPKVRKALAEAGDRETELHLYGAYAPKEIMALDDPKNRLRVFGPAAESIPTLRKYRALFAPLRFGAGIKGKISDAWSAGLPVLTTPIGAEGMGTELGFAGRIAHSEGEFFDQAVVIASAGASDERASLREAGRQALAALYGTAENRRKFLARIDGLLSPGALEAHRRSGLIGRILRSEAHGRTKYFSKWIEAKNR